MSFETLTKDIIYNFIEHVVLKDIHEHLSAMSDTREFGNLSIICLKMFRNLSIPAFVYVLDRHPFLKIKIQNLKLKLIDSFSSYSEDDSGYQHIKELHDYLTKNGF